MRDVVINGVSINALKKQREDLREGASKFISEVIEQATAYVQAIIESDDANLIDDLAEKATELLKEAELVSSVSGVEYYLPYSEPYDDNAETLSYGLENCDNELFSVYYGNSRNVLVDRLHDQLQTMENASYLWNSSSVHC